MPQSSPSNNKPEPKMKYVGDEYDPELPTSVASNNLKEQAEQILDDFVDDISQVGVPDIADKLLNLILDTILASEEMQDDKLNPNHRDLDTDDDYSCPVCSKNQARNDLRADLRAMLEGLR